MKKLWIGLAAIALMGSWPIQAAEKGHHGDGAYCERHCTASQLGKEVRALEKRIEAKKAALSSAGGGEKVASVMAKKEEIKRHIAQHEKELSDVKAALDRAEAGLREVEGK